jgi:hypothetical protein
MTITEVCSRIEEITNLILTNEREIDGLYFKQNENSFVDFSSINQLEIQNRLLREELNELLA